MSHFVLKERGIVLHRTDPEKSSHNRTLAGDVARLADGRLFARWELPGVAGPIEGCREWREGEDPTSLPWPVTEDPWRWQDGKLDNRNLWHRWTRAAERGEFDKFCDSWPEVAAYIGVTRYSDQWLIDCGECFFSRKLNPGEWKSCLDRHCAGDFGENGFLPAEPVDTSAAWTVTIQESRVRARHCIDTGRGVIRSRFPLEPSVGPSPGGGFMRDGSDRPQPKVTQRWCDVTTVYSPAGKRTLIELLP